MHGSHAHSHPHSNGHGHAHAYPEPSDKRYTIAIALNLSFVLIEAIAGLLVHSTALLADAAHNLSDVLGLALAGGAAWLAKRAASDRRTYGYAKATVLAALANALALVFACGAILWEAFARLADPIAPEPGVVMGVAAIGVLINGATALLFIRGKAEDVNVRGAYLHMLADAGVSAGVIVAGAAIWLTGFAWIDPIISIAVIALILWGAWGLLRESLDLAMDAAPAHIDVARVRTFLESQPGVIAVHDLHVWAMGARETALTAHLVRPDHWQDAQGDAFLHALTHALEHEFSVSHVTLQIELENTPDCGGHR